ncbi:MAG: hypothetical protein ACYDH6_22385 [Acidimicrobiales bacterium]
MTSAGSRPTVIGSACGRSQVVRDRLRVALGVLWVLDGLLQLQPRMFTQDFVGSLEQTVMAQPGWLAHTILWTTRFIGPDIAVWNLAFALLQLGLGAGILWSRTTKTALGVSCVWALGVWWIGEGLGGILTGFGTILAGAPGAAVLYAVAALVVWPAKTDDDGDSAAATGLLGERRTRFVWALLWCGVAFLQVKPGLPLPYRMGANFQETSIGEPGYLMHVDHVMRQVAQHWGTPLSYGLAAVEVAVGLGVLVGAGRRRLLAAALILLALIWVVGQNLGAMLTGSGTDPQAAPLFAFLALALWPIRERPSSPPEVAERRLAPAEEHVG